MSALVTDQFRILNANNFIDSVNNPSNSYYVWLGLPNPNENSGIGRTENWEGGDGVPENLSVVPNPIDNFNYSSHYKDTILFGKKISSSNIRRIIKRIDWVKGTKYDMYRHDYSIINKSPVSERSRLYDSNYYIMNSEYKVYICIQNGSSGPNPTGNQSQFEPTFTDLEPSISGTGEDGYVWKYLFTISPSDIVKFDSTEYITLPNNWDTSTDSQIIAIRENGNSQINENQIKTVYIENPGSGYRSDEVEILGDGTGGRVFIEVNSSGEIINTTVTSGGQGYTYGIVNLEKIRLTPGDPARLIPIIPPSYGHGYDIYKELGADKVLIYSRFDDSTRDFPIDTKFCQVGIIKNPSTFTSSAIYEGTEFSSLYAIKITNSNNNIPLVGERLIKSLPDLSEYPVGYVASYDSKTKVLKYFKDRSLYYNQQTQDETDYAGISSNANANIFYTSTDTISEPISGFTGNVSIAFTGSSYIENGEIINLGVNFTSGFANPEINKKTGDIIYIDNRPLVKRNIRQKEDVKIILEF